MSKRMNSILSFVSDQDYLPSLLSILSKARKQIDILSYSFAIGSAAGKINTKGAPFEVARKLSEIKEKSGDRMNIRFFTEGIRETSSRNMVTGSFLHKAGIDVRYGPTHAKGFCIDRRYVLFGSTNLTNQSMRKNYEANLLIDDKKAAAEFIRYFNHHWEGGGHGGIKLKLPFLADGDFKDDLIDMIDRAKKTISFAIYFFNHREIENALVRAHERGVHVKGFIHQHKSFAYPYIRANRATVKRMREKGIDDLHWGPPHTFSHSKYIVVDGKEVSLGTGNWLVEDVKIHPQLYFHTKDASLARQMTAHLDQMIVDSFHAATYD